MAWIIEKFWSWMDCDDHPENILTRDELLDNVMLYWLTASGASSARLYWESFGSFGGGDKVEIPTTGNAVDFGNLNASGHNLQGFSNGHGGL